MITLVIGEQEKDRAARGLSPDTLFVERFSYCFHTVLHLSRKQR